MTPTSVNKKQSVTAENNTEDKATAPKLVVDNSISLEQIKEPDKKEDKAKETVEKKSILKTEKPKKEIVKNTTKKITQDITSNVKKASTRATTTKEAKIKTSLVVQYQSIEVNTETLIDQVKEIWSSVHEKSEKDIKTLEMYIKPEEYSAYYVINDSVKGRLDL